MSAASSFASAGPTSTAYRTELSRPPCSECGHRETWRVVGPRGVLEDNIEDECFADELVEQLNDAHALGFVGGSTPATGADVGCLVVHRSGHGSFDVDATAVNLPEGRYKLVAVLEPEDLDV